MLPACSDFQQAFSGVHRNTASTYDIKATKNPAGFAALNLPGGMSVDLDTGAITGSPEVADFEVTSRLCIQMVLHRGDPQGDR